MIDKSVAICMLARDCKDGILRNKSKIEKLRSLFYKSYVVIVENDSIDGTKNVLSDWQNESHDFFILSKDTGTVTIPPSDVNGHLRGATKYRIDKMSMYRNQYLDFVCQHDNSIDYIIIIDIDVYDIDIDAVPKAIKNAPSDWTGLFANGKYFFKIGKKRIPSIYFDVYAYLPNNASHYDSTYEELYLNGAELDKKLKQLDYIPCKSAFGGFAIYKYEFLKNFHYETLENTRSNLMEVCCEHISLSKELNKYGTNYIVSDFNLLYGPHNYKGGIIHFLFGQKVFIKLLEFIKGKKLI